MKLIVYLLLAVAVTSSVISLNGPWRFKIGSNTTTYPANIPSTVHLDLMDNGLLKDPYVKANLLDAYWVETLDYEYSRNFTVSLTALNSRSQFIVFEGLDTHCDVFLNGQKILHADNMFRKWRQPIKLQQNNTLNIKFYSSANYDLLEEKKMAETRGFSLPANYSYTRKAAYQYGWDWGPRLLTVGIWKDAYIEAYNYTYLDNVQVRNSKVTRGIKQANLTVSTSLELDAAQNYTLTVLVDNGKEQVSNSQNVSAKNKTTVVSNIVVNNPELWWTRDVGTPFLYDISVLVYEANSAIPLLRKTLKYGIRTVSVSQNKDASGEEFTVVLNGLKIFMKGGNYIPPDMFLPRAKANPSVYDETIKAAVFANFNMLRVWGGGQFDDDYFYDICDRNGLLIWHDLMFACAMYPGSSTIYASIRQEMISNLVRLRNHPSIALWNGNNEVWIGWQEWGWKNNKTKEQQTLIQEWYNGIFKQTLRNVILEYDPDRFYWETSPSSSSNQPSTIGSGDIHFWRVWGGGTDIEEYETYVGRFNSEYGMQSWPEYSSILKFTDEADRTLNSFVMRLHQRHIFGDRYLPMYTNKYAGTTQNLERYTYFSQVMQQYALRTAVNSLRGGRPFCMGSLYWQLNDVWPVASWATVDYYGMYKAAQYSLRDMYSNIYIALVHKQTEKRWELRAINDNIDSISFELAIELIDMAGKAVKPIEKTGVTLVAGGNSPVKSYTEAQITAASTILKVSIANPDKKLQQSWIHYFTKPLSLVSKPPNVTMQSLGQGKYAFKTDTFAKSVYIYDKTGRSMLLQQNYFDIAPNSTVTVEIPNYVKTEDIAFKEYFTERALGIEQNIIQ